MGMLANQASMRCPASPVGTDALPGVRGSQETCQRRLRGNVSNERGNTSVARTRQGTPDQALLEEFEATVQSALVATRLERRVVRSVVQLMWAYIVCQSPRTVLNLMRTLGIKDWQMSRFYRIWSRQRWRADASFRWLQRSAAESLGDDPLVATVDSTWIDRAGSKFRHLGATSAHGLKAFGFWTPAAQRIVIGSLLTPVIHGYSRAIPVSAQPAFGRPTKEESPAKGKRASMRGDPSWYCQEWEAGLTVIQQIAESTGRQVLAVLDGAYMAAGFLRRLPESCLAMVCVPKHTSLYELPEDSDGRSSPRHYGKPAPTPAEWLEKPDGWHGAELDVRGQRLRLRYRVEGPFVRRGVPERPVFAILARGYRGQRSDDFGDVQVFLVTAVRNDRGQWGLPLQATDLLALHAQRCEQEILHQVLKKDFDLGEQPCWSVAASVTILQWPVWVFGILALCGYRVWGATPGREADAQAPPLDVRGTTGRVPGASPPEEAFTGGPHRAEESRRQTTDGSIGLMERVTAALAICEFTEACHAEGRPTAALTAIPGAYGAL